MTGFYMAAVVCFLLALVLPLGVAYQVASLGFKRLALFRLGITALWILCVGGLASTGFLSDFSTVPPRPFFFVFLALAMVSYWSFSKKTEPVLAAVSQQFLVGVQSFRIPVELFLWGLFVSGDIPIQMTFEGRNFDIVTGLLGAVLFFLLPRLSLRVQRWALWGFNSLGLVLLANIVITSILSMPVAFRYFMNEPANRIMVTFPFILLPTVLVPSALFFHLLSLRKLR